MAGETILVTGGAGYVGSQTCALLTDAGYKPVVVDDLSRGHRDLVRWGPIEQGTVGDAAFLQAVFARHAPAAVIHLAAYAYVAESVAHPDLYHRNNLIGGLTLLEAMKTAGCDRLVFSSTCSTYGEPDVLPIKETTPQRPLNPYGTGKLAMECAIAYYGAAFGLRSVVLRYFNVAGADPAGRCGERHDPEPHVIPNAIFAAFGRNSVFRIFGTDFDTPDGTCVRDFVHVADIARAHVLSIDRLMSGGPPLIANLANERGYSVREIVAAVEQVANRPVPVRLELRRPGDPAMLVADASVARDSLGWRPEWPALDRMIAHAIAWAVADGQIEPV